MRVYIGDHLERGTRVRNFTFNYDLAGFLTYTGGSHSSVFSLFYKRFTHKGKEAYAMIGYSLSEYDKTFIAITRLV